MPSSELIGLVALAAVFWSAICAVITAHVQSVVRDDAARIQQIEKLTNQRGRDFYHEQLNAALDRMDEWMDPPPFGRFSLGSRRLFGAKSLALCFTLSLAYSMAFYLIGWIAGGPGALGQVTLLDLSAIPSWLPDPLARLALAVVVLGVVVFFWLYVPAVARTSVRGANLISERLGWRGGLGWRCTGPQL